MMTSSNGNIFRVTGHLCGEFNGLRWIPRTKASDAELDVYSALCLNKRLRKQSWSRLVIWDAIAPIMTWRHCNDSGQSTIALYTSWFLPLWPCRPTDSPRLYVLCDCWTNARRAWTAYGSSEIYLKAPLSHERHHSDATNDYHWI